METAPAIDEEKVKSAMEAMRKIDLVKLMRAYVEMFEAYAALAKKLGAIQMENEDAFQAIAYLGSTAPQLLKMLASKSPPAEFGTFIKAFMDLIEIAPKLDNLMMLSAKEKIEVGEKLEKIATAFEEMVNKPQKEEKK
jgi:hypothetical protein